MIPNKSATTLITPSEREIVVTRTFDVPRQLLFKAITQPEHVRHWYGPRGLTMTVCEIDLRVGGRWRYVLRDPKGVDYGFSGEYREITPPERIVMTEGYEALPPGHDHVITVTLEEHNGRTTMTSWSLYLSVEDRDGHIQSGLEAGTCASYDRLAQHLQTLA